MGYYQGSGVVSGGGSSESVKETIYWHAQHTIYQKTTSTTTVKNGVSLETAQDAIGSMSVADKKFTKPTDTSAWFVSRACDGTSSSASYTRVGESSLYVLTITSNQIESRDSAGWTKGNP